MEHTQNNTRPEAATDEPASPSDAAAESAAGAFDSPAEESAFWKGVAHGVRCAARPEPSHRPVGFEPDAARSRAATGLASARLADAYVPVEEDVRGRAIRHDGLTPEKQIAFLSALSVCGVVADACRQAGIHRDTAYNLRNSAAGHAFALAWDAAILLARGRMSDELMSRAMNGCVDRIYKNGECVAERHRHDNRLAMAVLTRLDRQAEGMGEGAAVARIIGQDWERFLEIVRDGGETADEFLAAGAKQASAPEAAREIRSAARLLTRQKVLRLHEAGQADRIRIDDLDPKRMYRWSEDQWLRADLSGFLARLPEEAWPAYARHAEQGARDGNCRSRRVYVAHHPEAAELARDSWTIWKDEEERGCWLTDYPPSASFDGVEEGEWGDEDYKRTLSAAEQEVIAVVVANTAASEAAERAAALEGARAARDRMFGFAGDA